MPHIHTDPGQIDLTVEVFVVFGDRVLLRFHDKLDMWLSVGGHVELNEDPLEAAKREVAEEVGLVVEIDDSHVIYREEPTTDYSELVPPVFMCRVRMSPSHEHVTMTYFARSSTDEVVPSGDDRSDVWRWVTREELDDPRLALTPNIRFYAETALERLAGASRRRADQQVTHLENAALIVDDYDDAIHFFVDALGFDLVEDSPATTNDGRPKRWVVVRPPHAQTGILLAKADGHDQARFVGAQYAGRVGLFLRVADFDAAYQRMVDRGVVFVTDPRDAPHGRFAVFLDVAGNRWDLLGPVPA